MKLLTTDNHHPCFSHHHHHCFWMNNMNNVRIKVIKVFFLKMAKFQNHFIIKTRKRETNWTRRYAWLNRMRNKLNWIACDNNHWWLIYKVVIWTKEKKTLTTIELINSIRMIQNWELKMIERIVSAYTHTHKLNSQLKLCRKWQFGIFLESN